MQTIRKIRFLAIIALVILSGSSLFGQSFSMPELIKMSKMDTDSFDTFVISKGFEFVGGVEVNKTNGVKYGFMLNEIDSKKALKWVTLFAVINKYSINYQTSDKSEYLNIKNQIKQLGFKLVTSDVLNDEDSGSSHNYFMYKKGGSIVAILNRGNNFEISYIVNRW